MFLLTVSDLLHTTTLDSPIHSPIQLTSEIGEKHTDVDLSVFKRSLGYFLRTLHDSPTEPFSDNSVN